MKLRLEDELATARLGANLARGLGAPQDGPPEGVQLNLDGPLGAGKTTLVRGLLRALGVTGPVRSPTYTLIEPYHAAGWHVLHYDLYRIADPHELELLGAREHFARGCLRCIEWPQRGRGWLPEADLWVRLSHRDGQRDARLSAQGAFGQAWSAACAREYEPPLS